MRTAGLWLAVLLSATASFAADAAGVSKVVRAEVVTTDNESHKLTYKISSGDKTTAAVDVTAAARLTTLKPGDEVVVTLRESGGEQMVIALKKTATKKHADGDDRGRPARLEP